jgi:hypothetical protein
MANSWLRLWHDMPNDPKWRTISRASKQSISSVIAVYVHILVIASNANERGRTQNICNEDIASALDLDCEQVDAIIDAMQGRVLDGDLVSGWKKRQIEREDGGAERARAWRENKKRTQANASERKRTPDTDTDTDTDTDIKNKPSVHVGDEFARFWDAYPKKVGKVDAKKAWVKNKPPIDDVLVALLWQSKSDQWLKDGGQYIPNPSTYINQWRWHDEPQAIVNKPRSHHDSISDTMRQIFAPLGENNGTGNKIIDIANKQAIGSGTEDIPKLSNGLWEKAG